LSGSLSRHTAGDVIHDKFYVECKYRADIRGFNALKLFKEEVEPRAKTEGKIPLLVVKEKGKRGELVVLRFEDFIKLIRGAEDEDRKDLLRQKER
jgi:hypothetical protein